MPRRKSNSGPSVPQSPPPASQNKRKSFSPVAAGELCAGCIVWLPPKDPLHAAVRCNKDSCCENKELDDGGYDHPVIVLSIKQRCGSKKLGDLICCVACVTTFSDTKLSKYLAKRLRKNSHLKNSLPIKDPDAPEIGSYGITVPEEFELERDQRLSKQSYVRLEHNFEVPASMLRQWDFGYSQASKKRLSQSSYALLMNKLDLTPETWYTTRTLGKTAKKRLSALADSAGSLEDTFTPLPQPLVHSPNYNPYEHLPPRPPASEASTTRPTTPVPSRSHKSSHPRVYPAYQQSTNYTGLPAPRWSLHQPESEPEKGSPGFWLFGLTGVLVFTVFAWFRFG